MVVLKMEREANIERLIQTLKDDDELVQTSSCWTTGRNR